MPITRWDPKGVLPDLIDWFEEPFMGLRPYLPQPIRIEDYVDDGHYVVRAEIAGVDPAKDLDISVGAGYLSIHAERSSHVEGKHRSEFRYGTFSRSLQLPESANPDDVTAEYTGGILTVKVGLRDVKADTRRKVEISSAES
jgi:HSP20 family protein